MCKREEAEASCPVFRGEVEPVSTEAVSDPQPAGCVLTFEVKQKRKNKKKKKNNNSQSTRARQECLHRLGNSSI